MLITFSITQNQEPIQNLLKGGKGIFFHFYIQGQFLAVVSSSQNVLES